MKPIIGICADYVYGITELYDGFGSNFNWQVITDDYVTAIENAGGMPIIIPVISIKENIDRYLEMIDGIIFAGGYDVEAKRYGDSPSFKIGAVSPERDEQEIYLAKKIIYETRIPTLGICRGCQILNVAGGGDLYQDLVEITPKNDVKIINHSIDNSPKYNPVHKANIKKHSKMYKIFNEEVIEINSYHHQVIKNVSEEFEATVIATDGVVEGIEIKDDRFVVGTQWHPKMMAEKVEKQRLIFESFIEATKKFKLHE